MKGSPPLTRKHEVPVIFCLHFFFIMGKSTMLCELSTSSRTTGLVFERIIQMLFFAYCIFYVVYPSVSHPKLRKCILKLSIS